MASCNSRHQHSPWPYQDHCPTNEPQGMEAWSTSFNRVSGGRSHMPFTSACPATETVKPEDIIKVPDSSIHLICPHEPQVSSRPGVIAWTTDTNMASVGIMDHGGPSRRFSPESEPFFILGLCHCPELGGNLETGWHVEGQEVGSLRLHVSGLSPLSHLSPCHISSSASLPRHTAVHYMCPF